MNADHHSGMVLSGICKTFGSHQVLDNADFSAARGEITGLVGENGAGKTTLVRIVAGLEHADAGQVLIDNEPLTLKSPVASIRRGIGMVHQHFMLFDDLTVADNIIFGAEPTRRGRLDTSAIEDQISTLMESSGLHLPMRARIADLSVGQRQRVEILKVLQRGAEFLLLDEPSAVLTPQEADELFMVLQDLKSRGHGIVLITHRLQEVMQFTDRVTVLRKGKTIGTSATTETDADTLAELMVGRKPHRRRPADPPVESAPVLEVHSVSTQGAGSESLDDVTFTVGSGEIVGIAGVTGNGQSHLAEVLLGLRTANSGCVMLSGQNITGLSTSERRTIGMSYIPEDRFARGLAGDESIVNNAAIGHLDSEKLCRGPLLHKDSMKAWAATIIDQYDVRGDVERAGDLSGGNAQKLVFGRELTRPGNLVIAEQPTRGVDVGAIEQLHSHLETRRAAGAAVLLISADLDEILQMSQRILVLYDGHIAAELPANADRYQLGRYMTGLADEQAVDR